MWHKYTCKFSSSSPWLFVPSADLSSVSPDLPIPLSHFPLPPSTLCHTKISFYAFSCLSSSPSSFFFFFYPFNIPPYVSSISLCSILLLLFLPFKFVLFYVLFVSTVLFYVLFVSTVLFCTLFVCKRLLLPPDVNPIAVKYIIKYQMPVSSSVAAFQSSSSFSSSSSSSCLFLLLLVISSAFNIRISTLTKLCQPQYPAASLHSDSSSSVHVCLYRNVGFQPIFAHDDLFGVSVLHDASHPVVHNRSAASKSHGHTSPLQRHILRLHGHFLLPDHPGHSCH